jgi:hypothetical protein
MLNNVATSCIVTPEIPVVVADPAAVPPVLPVAAVPQSITYSNSNQSFGSIFRQAS